MLSVVVHCSGNSPVDAERNRELEEGHRARTGRGGQGAAEEEGERGGVCGFKWVIHLERDNSMF